MAGMFGMDFRSKAEKAKDYEVFSNRIFPYGEAQKEKVVELLNAACPKNNIKYLLMYYIMIKDEMTGNPPLKFQDAASKIGKKRAVVRVTPKLEQILECILIIDLRMNESLEYPSYEEICLA